jgi:hypothetical protein
MQKSGNDVEKTIHSQVHTDYQYLSSLNRITASTRMIKYKKYHKAKSPQVDLSRHCLKNILNKGSSNIQFNT